MNRFRFPASFLFYSFSGISPFEGTFHLHGRCPSMVQGNLWNRSFSSQSGMDCSSSSLFMTEAKRGPPRSPVRHYFPNHGVEEKPDRFRPAFPIFLRQKTVFHQFVQVQGKDGWGMKPLPFSLLPVVPFGEKEGRPIVLGRQETGSRGRASFCRGLYIPCHGIPLWIRLLRRCR